MENISLYNLIVEALKEEDLTAEKVIAELPLIGKTNQYIAEDIWSIVRLAVFDTVGVADTNKIHLDFMGWQDDPTVIDWITITIEK